MAASGAAIALSRPVGTTDLWKAAALLFMFADHYGFYFAEDDEWWRVLGSAAAPVFFFLVGFAHSRRMPWSWIAFGAMLTALDLWTSDPVSDAKLNILLNFALIRLALPWIEAWVLPHPARLAACALACIVLTPVAGEVLEYGSEGWLWTLFGLLQREALEHGRAKARWLPTARTVMAVATAAVYVVVQAAYYEFGPRPALVLAVLIAVLAALLARFRRTQAGFQPPQPVAAALVFIGRHTLEIYALHLIALEIIVHVLP